MITPRPSSDHTQPKAGYPMTPFFGVDPVMRCEYVTIVTAVVKCLLLLG